MVDGWRGDDWFHNGALRQQNMPYIYEQDESRSNESKWWTSHFVDYDVFLEATSAGALGHRRTMEQEFWQDQTVDQILAKNLSLFRPSSFIASGMRKTPTAPWQSIRS